MDMNVWNNCHPSLAQVLEKRLLDRNAI